MVELKLIERSVTPHDGYGAGEGEIIREEYECPCGKGKVIYEKDAIPGFRDSSTWCTCSECKEKYDFE
ncbi:hypothetical protein J2Z32_004335 [Paenibacillus turicensis]|uniref:Uncharacterized protein n=1 Tax=Paenibacillus turicensis TaxID=160487 RepID=A0ABS4FYJ8_9BACL|nr:hypothetical protein [Paenibacillus turicensis]MBP1907655.1 hypothetical protein [Paenibacillus turicensis]